MIAGDIQQKCRDCGMTDDSEKFPRNGHGIIPYCRECFTKRQRAGRLLAKRKKQKAEYNKAYARKKAAKQLPVSSESVKRVIKRTLCICPHCGGVLEGV